MSQRLEVEELSVSFGGRRQVCAVDRANLVLRQGEVVALLGESGCGKSTTAMAVAGLLPPNARVSGRVRLGGRDLRSLDERDMSDVRGREIGVIFQEPTAYLTPVIAVGTQVAEALVRHQSMKVGDAIERTIELFGDVGISDPKRRVREYPHQLSGGMCQRVMIAMAIACGPTVMIADEPTASLDTTVQATILSLLRDLVDRTEMALLLITHDLGVVAQIADRVIVMYAGKTIEEAKSSDLFANPRHPYTNALLAATPTPGGAVRARLREIPGVVPRLREPPRCCPFVERCERSLERCRHEMPLPSASDHDHLVACFNPTTTP